VCHVHGEALRAEASLKRLGKVALVLYDQHPHGTMVGRLPAYGTEKGGMPMVEAWVMRSEYGGARSTPSGL